MGEEGDDSLVSQMEKLIGKPWSCWKLPEHPLELLDSSSMLHHGNNTEIDFFSIGKCPACGWLLKIQQADQHFRFDSRGDTLVCKDTELAVFGNKVVEKVSSQPSPSQLELERLQDTYFRKVMLNKYLAIALEAKSKSCSSSPFSEDYSSTKTDQLSEPKKPQRNNVNVPSGDLHCSVKSKGLDSGNLASTSNFNSCSPPGMLNLPFCENEKSKELPNTARSSSSLSSPCWNSSIRIYENGKPIATGHVIPANSNSGKLKKSSSLNGQDSVDDTFSYYEKGEKNNENMGKHVKMRTKRKRNDIDGLPEGVVTVKTGDGGYNPDKHCGVGLPGNSFTPCKRNLNCKLHSVFLRRAVVGRSQSFDTLVAAQKLIKAEEKAKKSTCKETVENKQSSTPQPDKEIVIKMEKLDCNVMTTAPTNLATNNMKTTEDEEGKENDDFLGMLNREQSNAPEFMSVEVLPVRTNDVRKNEKNIFSEWNTSENPVYGILPQNWLTFDNGEETNLDDNSIEFLEKYAAKDQES